MPTLPAAVDKNAYAPHDSFRNYLPKQSVHIDNLLTLFFKAFIEVLLASFLIMSPWWIQEYLLAHCNTLWEHHHLYLFREIFRCISWYYFIAFMCYLSTRKTYIYSIIISTNHRTIRDIYPKNKLYIFLWILCSSITAVSLCIVSAYYHSNPHFRHDTIQFPVICNFAACNKIHWYQAYKYIFGFPCSIWFAATLNHIVYIIYYLRCKPKSNYVSATSSYAVVSRTSKTELIHIHSQSHNDFEEKLLSRYKSNFTDEITSSNSSHYEKMSKGQNILKGFRNEIQNENIGLYKHQHSRHGLYEQNEWIITNKFYGYIVAYSIFLLIYLSCVYFIVIINKDNYQETNFKLFTYEIPNFWIISTSLKLLNNVFNFILKRLARNIDILRMQKPEDKFLQFADMAKFDENRYQKSGHKLSFEVISQVFMRLHYWLQYRYITIYDQPELGTFIATKMNHVVELMYTAVIRPSKWYFKWSNIILNRIRNYVYTPRCIKWCLSFYCSKSNMKQWGERIAIDTMLRFGIAIGSCVLFIVLLLIVTDETGIWRMHETGLTWNRALNYTGIGMLLELIIYFPFTYVCYRYGHKTSLIQPVLRFYMFNHCKVVWMIAVIFGVTAYMLTVTIDGSDSNGRFCQ
eukprot:221522_1